LNLTNQTLQLIGRGGILLLACVFLSMVSRAQTEGEAAADIPYSSKGADTCLACHGNEAVFPVFKTKHAMPSDPRSPFGQGQLQCEACHGPGGTHAGRVRRGRERPPVIRFTADSVASVATQNEMCLGCHKADAGLAWHGGPHEDNEVSCAGCHQLHTADDPVLRTSTQAEKCYDCHAFRESDSLKAYAHPLREGKMACTGCHSLVGDTTELQLARQTVNSRSAPRYFARAVTRRAGIRALLTMRMVWQAACRRNTCWVKAA
jgi:predicted CXXCH cytochrome family protein